VHITALRIGIGALAAIVFASPAMAATEWQVRPFIGLTFGGGTTLVDVGGAQGHGRTKLVTGLNGGFLGEIFGIDVDLAHAPGYFEVGHQSLVSSSSVTTFTGSVVVGVPKSRTVYTLRPYVLGGLGVMHAEAVDFLGLNPRMTRPAVNVGGGVTGFLSDRVGLNWDLRYFRSVGGDTVLQGDSLSQKRLSFWRANMALVVKLR
jgi:outer membrane protein with beta-barrel domain